MPSHRDVPTIVTLDLTGASAVQEALRAVASGKARLVGIRPEDPRPRQGTQGHAGT